MGICSGNRKTPSLVLGFGIPASDIPFTNTHPGAPFTANWIDLRVRLVKALVVFLLVTPLHGVTPFAGHTESGGMRGAFPPYESL